MARKRLGTPALEQPVGELWPYKDLTELGKSWEIWTTRYVTTIRLFYNKNRIYFFDKNIFSSTVLFK